MAASSGLSPINIGVCLVAEDLFGKITGLRECAEIMERLNFESVVFRVAFVWHGNDMVFDGEPMKWPDNQRDLVRLASAIASPHTVVRAMKVAASLRGLANFHPFSDQALAATIELAGRRALRTGGIKFDDPNDLDLLARIIFSFQAATFSPQFMRLLRSSPAWESIDETKLAEVIRNHLAHNSVGSSGNAVARLYGMMTSDQVLRYFMVRTGESLDAWFKRRLSMDTKAYLRAALMVCACSARFDGADHDLGVLAVIEDRVAAQLPEKDRENFRRLMRLGKISAADLGKDRQLDVGLTEFLYQSVQLRIRPFIDLGERCLASSVHQVTDKFMFGLPHLLDEAARENHVQVDISKVRMKAGHLFESYIALLFQEWLAGQQDWTFLPHFRLSDTSPDWDMVVVRGDTAYYFEAKARVFILGMRMTGAFEALDRMLLAAFKETWIGAERLLAAAQSCTAPPEIRNVRRIVPALIVFDRVPIRLPFLDRYEKHVESELKLPIFTGVPPKILPIQTFEIEGIECWEEYFELPKLAHELFAYLEARAADPLKRHDRKFPGDRPKKWRTANGPLNRMLRESRAFFEDVARSVNFEEK